MQEQRLEKLPRVQAPGPVRQLRGAPRPKLT
jgi:hypothetical protein